MKITLDILSYSQCKIYRSPSEASSSHFSYSSSCLLYSSSALSNRTRSHALRAAKRNIIVKIYRHDRHPLISMSISKFWIGFNPLPHYTLHTQSVGAWADSWFSWRSRTDRRQVLSHLTPPPLPLLIFHSQRLYPSWSSSIRNDFCFTRPDKFTWSKTKLVRT